MRTVFYEVADLNQPAPEPFAVIRIDVAKRSGNGVEGIVQSFHWTREEAFARAKELAEEDAGCKVCGGSGFSGYGSGYDAVCGECGGLGRSSQ